MPRKKLGPEASAAHAKAGLAEELAAELKDNHEFGQPLIWEQTFETGKARVTVIWDKWVGMPLQDRTATILRAYEMAEGAASRARIALASGLTVPEAYGAGMLPFQIFPALRKSDPVTPEQARQAMIELGGSTLFGPGTVQLRFPTRDDAMRARANLVERFPGTDDVWAINHDVLAPDSVHFEDEEMVTLRPPPGAVG